MHVVIMGCGRVGATLAHNLEQRGYSVAVIDQDDEAFRRLGPGFEGRTVKGPGFDPDVLREAGVDDASAFVAVSSGDNSNIVSARVARETFGVENVAARIYDPGRAEVFQRLGIPTVATVQWTVDQLVRRLFPETIVTEWIDPSGAIQLADVGVGENWYGRTVGEFERTTGVRVATLTRLGVGMLPRSSTVIQDGDLVHAMLPQTVPSGMSQRIESGPKED